MLPIDKPMGLTSHDVVAAVRRATGEGRVGHAGTLDPSATGVLVILIGSATRLTPLLTAAQKTYQARITFGTATDTDDADGTVTHTAAVPQTLTDPEVARTHIASIMGPHEQVPPAYSAIKRGGVVAHRAARSGSPIELRPRTIEILDSRLNAVQTGGELSWDVTLTVSKGTYIRALARDIGTSLGTVAHLSALRRLSSGAITLADAFPLSEVVDAPARVPGHFTDPVSALGVPLRVVTPDEVPRINVGSTVGLGDLADVPPGTAISMAEEHRLWAVYRVSPAGDILVPDVVLAGGVAR
ncbi:MAG: tRNA pseudouridine(55) synthase TruB [Coriobacteriia bacterium]|nr:tRNA pseudouridine(55) synthase TruB [Coriobacteriia bacterium]